jgi:hypothetical protein
MGRKRSIRQVVFIAIVFALVAAPTLLAAVWQISRGHGADAYTNVWGLAIHWMSPLILVVALVVTLLVAFIARMIILRRDRRDAMKIIRKIVIQAASDSDK